MDQPPDVPEPVVPPFKVRKEVRAYLHGRDFHDLCRIYFEPVITGHDLSRKYLPGPERTEVDPAGNVIITRDFIDVSTMRGDPIYSGRVREIHR